MNFQVRNISTFVQKGDTFLLKKNGTWIPSILNIESGFYINDLIKKTRIVLLERVSSVNKITY